MDLFESTVYAHPIDEIYEGDTSNIAEEELKMMNAASSDNNITDIVSIATTMLPLVIIAVLLYLVLIRPQRKAEKEARKMVRLMAVGDEVVTEGGICGKVIDMKDNYVYIEIGSIEPVETNLFLKVEADSIKAVKSTK